MLPPAARLHVRATQAAVPAPWLISAEQLVDPETIAVLALACRDSEVVRFAYQGADGRLTERQVEPVALVPRAPSLVSRRVGQEARRLANVPPIPAR